MTETPMGVGGHDPTERLFAFPQAGVQRHAEGVAGARLGYVDDGLTPVAKTSGSKGMQVYCGIRTRSPLRPPEYAKALAERLAAQTPALVTARMAKALRPGKVFIDWSQNNPARTTVAPYSLRGRGHPTVSTPLAWDEVAACRRPQDLVFTAEDVIERVERFGDLFTDVADARVALPR